MGPLQSITSQRRLEGPRKAIGPGPMDRHLVHQYQRQVEPAQGSQADLVPASGCTVRLCAVRRKPGLAVVIAAAIVPDVGPLPREASVTDDIGCDAAQRDQTAPARRPAWFQRLVRLAHGSSPGSSSGTAASGTGSVTQVA
jgi:hypothetical protein